MKAKELPPPPETPISHAMRQAVIQALDFAIRIVTNFEKDEALARLSNLREGYRRPK